MAPNDSNSKSEAQVRPSHLVCVAVVPQRLHTSVSTPPQSCTKVDDPALLLPLNTNLLAAGTPLKDTAQEGSKSSDTARGAAVWQCVVTSQR